MSTIALVAWPLVTLVLVLRLPFPKAVLISILGGFLLLPPNVGINLPVLPSFNKETIPSLTLLVLALLVFRRGSQAPGRLDTNSSHGIPGWIPRSVFAVVALLMVVFGAIMTALTNDDRLVYGPTVIPGMRLYDGFSLALTGLTMLVPLLLGRKFFAHPENQILLLRGLIVGGLVYSLLALYEVRMSPQLNIMVYGFFPHQWMQHIRGFGWRPVVFMEHGLQLAIFFVAATLAAFGASRCLEERRRGVHLLAGVWLLGTLVLSNSFGALIIAITILPAVLFLGVRMQMLVAGIIAGIILLYPMLRSADLVPTERIVSMAETINPQRAGSLQYRFENEDMLLEHARERPFFGWGGWRRNRVFDDSGQDLSTTDGAWIIVMGQMGWAGYLAEFGFLTLPIILLALNRRRFEVSPVTAVLALILAASLIDLLPNGFLSPVSLLLAGALWGRLELGASVETTNETVRAPGDKLSYAREGPLMKAPPDEQERPTYTRQVRRHERAEKPH